MNDALRAELHDRGYIVVPLLAPDDVARLRADFDACHPGEGRGFETDFERDDGAFKEGVATRSAWVWDRVGEILPGYAPFMASYLVKWPTPDSDLPLHADWSYVDESIQPSYAVWVPLVDTGPDIDNGPLAVVPGSHRLVRSWRGTDTPAWYAPGKEGFVAAAVAVEAPAGHAVVFDNRLLHHSPPNHGPTRRPVLAGAFAPRGSRFVHVIGDGAGRGRVLDVDATFFRDHTPAGLRRERPPVPATAPEVALVEGSYDPVELAADHDVDDAAAFRRVEGAPARCRWPRPEAPLSVERPQTLLDGSLDLATLPWAPASIAGVADAAVHLPLVVESRITPWGASLLAPLATASPGWVSLRLLRVGPGDTAEVAGVSVRGRVEVGVVGLAPGDPSLLVEGRGWASLEPGASVVVPDARFRVRNRASCLAAVLIAEPDVADRTRLRAWRARLGSPPEAWRQAVELTEAVS